jgi:sugar lactone lactonase YvrE
VPILWRTPSRPKEPRRPFPLAVLALGAALAGQLALGQGAWLAGGLLFVAAALLLGSSTLGGPPAGHPDAALARGGSASTAPNDAIESRLGEVRDARQPDSGLIGGWRGVAALLFVIILAAAFRVPMQGTVLPGLAADEARIGLDAVQVLAGRFSGDGWDGWPIFHLLTVFFVGILGQTQLAVRLPAILGGIAFAGAIYLLGRQLGGTLLGTIVGVLGAAIFWHVDTTRAAWGYASWGVTAEALGVALLLHAVRGRLPISAGFAGVLFGLALQVSWSAIPAIIVGGLLAARTGGDGRANRAGRWSLPPRAVLAPLLVYFVIAAGPVIIGVSVPDRDRALAASLNTDATAQTPLLQRLGRFALAFNVTGDPNPLHNIGGSPQLDPVTAPLLVLGVALAAVRWRSRRGAVLLLWLLGVLVIAAVAGRGAPPDMLAAFHAVTPVLLLAGSALLAVCGQVPEMTPTVPRWRLDLLLLLLGVMLAINGHTVYVRRPADAAAWAAFGSAEMLAARQITPLLPTHTIYLADVWLNDPTIQFLTPGLSEPRLLDASATLPLRQDESLAYFAPGRQEVVAEDLERIYEDGEIDRFRSPLDETQVVLRSFRVSDKVVAAARGVTLRITSPDRSRSNRVTLPVFDLNWPISGEASRGSALDLFTALAVEIPGTYRFRLDGPPNATLELNGRAVGHANEEIVAALAAGNQRVRVLATTEGDSKIRLRWQPPGSAELVAIPLERLYREQRAATGLLAAYQQGANPASAPDLLRVERYVQREAITPPVPRPYTLDLVGVLDVPKDGTYRFRLTGSGPVGMWLDDLPVPLGALPTDEPSSIVLDEGDHNIRLRLYDEVGPTSFNLTWAPPGENWGAIPTSRFTPPNSLADAPVLAAVQPDSDIRALGSPQVFWLASLEGEPRAVAVGPDGTAYVTNITTRETQRILDPEAAPVALAGSAASVPADVEVGPDGHVWVLDALDGQLRRIDPATGGVTLVGGQDLSLYRPRGFALAPDGTILVADTGGSRVVRLSATGVLLGTVAPDVRAPARVRQPTDVAVAANGDVYVVNGEDGVILHLAPDGTYIGHWMVMHADTERGSHLAIGPDGGIWVSEPDGRRISRFTPAGVPAGVVDQTREGRLLRAPVGITVGADGTLYVADVSLRAVLAIRFGR